MDLIDNIRVQIQAGLVESDLRFDFLPHDKLEEIFSDSMIQSVINDLNCDKDELLSLPKTIRDGGKKVLAMLIWQKRPELIVEFRNHGFLDSRLPMEEADMTRLAGQFDGIALAKRTQWMFCPYVFPKDMWEYHRQIDRRMILPFTEVEHIGDGAFGQIDKISISPSQQHLMDRGTGTVQVARKRLKVRGETPEYRREKGSIRLLNQLRHPNIISFLGSYTHGNENFFLFRYMELDLWNFLRREQRYEDFQNDCTFYSALAGLASALSKTHDLDLNYAEHDIDLKAIGYHHDIRPPNILVSADTFVLADFGLGMVKPKDAPSHTPYKPISGDYVAPECTDKDENPSTVNRAIDVWAFGCLLFEVVTYMLQGVDGIEKFRTKRTMKGRLSPQWEDSGFYQPEGDVKEEVRQWKDALTRNHPDSGMTGQLLELAMDALHREPGKRPKMDTVSQHLATLSMRKHSIVVLETFREIYDLLEKQLDPDRRQLEKLRYAQARFQIWGNSLSLSDDIVSDHPVELLERYVGIMKELLRHLDMAAMQDKEHESRDSRILHGIESLWQLLPPLHRQSANAQWSLWTTSIESTHHPQGPHPVIDSNQSVSERTAVIHRIPSQFEEAARIFKERLPKSVSWDNILEIGSSDEFYIIAARLQEEQSQTGGLRNLAKIKLFLDRLEGFTRIISDTISKHRDVLAAIWGPIVFLLQRAKDLDHAYDSLLSAFAGIGLKLPDFEVSYQNSEMGEIMLLFFKDLLIIYHDMLELLSHCDWMHIFGHLWPKHDATIREIGSHIERLTRLSRTEIRLEHIQQEHDFRNTALRDLKTRDMAALSTLQSLDFQLAEMHAELKGIVRILVSSRPEADLVQRWADAVDSIQVDDHNEASTRSYVNQRSQEIFDGHEMHPDSRNKIRGLLSPLASKAKGMFLYAQLVMNMLTSMHEYSDIEKSLKVLPEKQMEVVTLAGLTAAVGQLIDYGTKLPSMLRDGRDAPGSASRLLAEARLVRSLASDIKARYPRCDHLEPFLEICIDESENLIQIADSFVAQANFYGFSTGFYRKINFMFLAKRKHEQIRQHLERLERNKSWISLCIQIRGLSMKDSEQQIGPDDEGFNS